MKKAICVLSALLISACSSNNSGTAETIDEFKSKSGSTDITLFRIGAESFSYAPGGIAANKGAKTGPDSIMDKRKIRAFYSEKQLSELIEDFDSGALDVLVLPLSAYADSYHRLKRFSPVVFLLSGWSNGNEALIVPDAVQSIDDLANGIIACMRTSPEFYTMSAVVANTYGKSTTNFVNARDNDEILEMLGSGKARAAIVNLNGIREIPKGYKVLVSSALMSKSSPYVYITRKLLLAQRKDAITQFIAGTIEGNYSLLGQRQTIDPETAKLITSPSGKLFTAPATVTDNTVFFRMNSRSGYDFNSLVRYNRFYSMKKELQRGIAFESTANYLPFESAGVGKMSRQDSALSVGYGSGSRILFTLKVHFSGSDLRINADSDTELQTVVMTADQSPRSILLISYQPSSYEGRNTAFVYPRLTAVKNYLRSKNISAWRMRDNSGDIYQLRQADPSELPESASVLIQFAE